MVDQDPEPMELPKVETINLAKEAVVYKYTCSIPLINGLGFNSDTISPRFKQSGLEVAGTIISSTWYFRYNLFKSTITLSSDGTLPKNTEIFVIFSLVAQQGHEVCRKEKHVFLDPDEPNITIEKFTVSHGFLEGKDGICVNGKLTFRCRLCFFPDSLLIPTIHRNRINDFEKLLTSGAHSDVTFIVEDEELRVHKCILAARSRVFSAMFEHDMRENSDNVVKITDVKIEVMKKLLRFIYSSTVDDIKTNAKDLLAVAEKYEIEELKSLCEEEILKTLNISNVGELLAFADMYKANKLKTKAVKFIISNKNSIDKDTLQKQTNTITCSIFEFIHNYLEQ